MKVDFSVQKTEVEWNRAIDAFGKKLGPLWFQWLEWLLILGAVDFVAKQTQSSVLRLVAGLSYGVLFLYLQGVFHSMEFYGFPVIKSERGRRIASIALSAILCVLFWLLFTEVAQEIQGRV